MTFEYTQRSQSKLFCIHFNLFIYIFITNYIIIIMSIICIQLSCSLLVS